MSPRQRGEEKDLMYFQESQQSFKFALGDIQQQSFK